MSAASEKKALLHLQVLVVMMIQITPMIHNFYPNILTLNIVKLMILMIAQMCLAMTQMAQVIV